MERKCYVLWINIGLNRRKNILETRTIFKKDSRFTKIVSNFDWNIQIIIT